MGNKNKPIVEETKEFKELIMTPLKKVLDSYKLKTLSKKGEGIIVTVEKDGVEATLTIKHKKKLKNSLKNI